MRPAYGGIDGDSNAPAAAAACDGPANGDGDGVDKRFGAPLPTAGDSAAAAAVAPAAEPRPGDAAAMLVSLLAAADREGMLHRGGDRELPNGVGTLPSGSAIAAAVEYMRMLGAHRD